MKGRGGEKYVRSTSRLLDSIKRGEVDEKVFFDFLPGYRGRRDRAASFGGV